MMKGVAGAGASREVALMKRPLFVLVAALAVLAGLHAAEEKFSRSIRPGDFSAAGLGKLTPEEIAQLDRLVGDYKSGALERARRDAAAAETRAAQAEAKAVAAAAAAKEKADDRAGGGSLLSKAKVLLTPGTEIEYTTVESRLVGEFRGWQGRTIFNLENGQRWQSTGTDTYVQPRPLLNPAVKITPGMLGTFWLTVDGVKARVKVALVSSK